MAAGTGKSVVVALAAAGAAAATAAMAFLWYRRRRKNASLEDPVHVKPPSQSLIVITGCDRGFGRQLYERLAQNSEYVLLGLTLHEESVSELLALGDDKKRLFAKRCNVTSSSDIQATAKMIDAEILSPGMILYGLVNNAGCVSPGDFLWYKDTSTHRRIMDVNFFGQLDVTKALLPIMLRTSRTNGGRILNLSSVCGMTATPANSAYCASKFAVEAWSDSLRMELHAFGIRVVKIRPGAVATQIQHDYLNQLSKNFQKASPVIRNMYGGDGFGASIDGAHQASGPNIGGSPSVVIDLMTELLTSKPASQLEAMYLVGEGARTFFKPVSEMPTAKSDVIKRSMLYFAPQVPEKMPPLNVTSHITIVVRNLEKSLTFYKAFGFEPFGSPATINGNPQQFIEGNPTCSNGWATLVLLKQDPKMPTRGESYDAGFSRLALYTISLLQDMERLKAEHGLEPYGPLAESSNDRLIVYKDPDGFTVYLIQITGAPMSWIVKAHMWWNRVLYSPKLFHVTANVPSGVHEVLQSLQQLGCLSRIDIPNDKVARHMLPSFKLDADSTVIEFIRLASLTADDGVMMCVMQWTKPETRVTGSEALNRVTLSVSDVPEWLQKAKQAGLHVPSLEPTFHELPMYGVVQVGTVFLQAPNICPIDLCCFTTTNATT